MYNPGADQEKNDMSSNTPYYPQPDNQVTPPQYPTPHPGAAYPQQPMGGAYPQPPFQQQPTSTMHNTNTTVVIQQQPAAIVVQGPREWSSGICDCFDDCGVCLVGLCSCLCGIPIIECQVSGAAGECFCVGVCCPVALRTQIRARHNIQGSIFNDCCALVCCHYCAMCQMQREINLHGMQSSNYETYTRA